MDPLKIYLQSIAGYNDLSNNAVRKLILKDRTANRKRLINGNLRRVASIAIEMHRAWDQLDVMDYIQEGNIILIKYVDSFEPNRGIEWSTYLTYGVRGAILRFIRSNMGAVKLGTTAGQRKIFANLSQIKEMLIEKGFSLQEISNTFGVPADDIESVLQSGNKGCLYGIQVVSPEKIHIKNETAERLLRKIYTFRKGLNERELVVFDDHLYEGNKTLQEIADFFSTSKMSIQRDKVRILKMAAKVFTKTDLSNLLEDSDV